jgi:hypothetical protein
LVALLFVIALVPLGCAADGAEPAAGEPAGASARKTTAARPFPPGAEEAKAAVEELERTLK